MADAQLSEPVIQVPQVLTILVFAPGLSGAIAHIEARLQGRRGPRILQPYYDLAKLFRKETLVPEDASWVFLAGPMVAFTCYLVVPLLIPVLTTYGLPLGYMGDILGGGFILALAGFSVALAAAETDAPYAQLGCRRAMTFGADRAVDPLRHLLRGADHHHRPALRGGGGGPGVAERGRPPRPPPGRAGLLSGGAERHRRIPVETHAGTLEFGMIDEARTLEHSGPLLALLKWGSAMKQMILYVLLINVFVAPWGLAELPAGGRGAAGDPGSAGQGVRGRGVFAVIDNSFSKLRLFKITEFMAAAFLLAILAVIGPLPGRRMTCWSQLAHRHRRPSPAPPRASPWLVLLTEFAMLRAPLCRSQVRLYAFQSLAVTALAVFVAATHHIPELYVLAGLSFVLKVVVVPLVVLRLLRDARGGPGRQSNRLSVATMVLLAIGMSVFGVLRGRQPARALPLAADPGAGHGRGGDPGGLPAGDPARRCGLPGGRVLLVGERGVGGQPGGGRRPAAHRGGGVSIRPAGGGGRLRGADAGAPRADPDPLHRPCSIG